MVAFTFKRPFARQTAIAFFMLTACASAFAVSTWDNFNLSSNCTPDTSSGSAVATCTPQSVTAGTLTLNGVSTGTLVNTTSTITTNFNSALIYDWGTTNGLGVVAENESYSKTGPHAMDNKYGTDAMLLNFSVATKLDSIKLGWNGSDDRTATQSYRDSDLSIFSWTGGVAGPTIANVGPASLLAANSGWSLVGNFFNAGTLSNNTVTTASDVYSSYWLVSAYDASYGGSDPTGGRTGYDAFKVLAISANVCTGNTCPTPPGVPEPGSLALISAAFMGFVVSRGRLRKASS